MQTVDCDNLSQATLTELDQAITIAHDVLVSCRNAGRKLEMDVLQANIDRMLDERLRRSGEQAGATSFR